MFCDFLPFPLSHGLRRASSPASGGAFGRGINSKPKASLSMEVDFAKQKTEGVKPETAQARHAPLIVAALRIYMRVYSFHKHVNGNHVVAAFGDYYVGVAL